VCVCACSSHVRACCASARAKDRATVSVRVSAAQESLPPDVLVCGSSTLLLTWNQHTESMDVVPTPLEGVECLAAAMVDANVDGYLVRASAAKRVSFKLLLLMLLLLPRLWRQGESIVHATRLIIARLRLVRRTLLFPGTRTCASCCTIHAAAC
jgi:hypothetical protein